ALLERVCPRRGRPARVPCNELLPCVLPKLVAGSDRRWRLRAPQSNWWRARSTGVKPTSGCWRYPWPAERLFHAWWHARQAHGKLVANSRLLAKIPKTRRPLHEEFGPDSVSCEFANTVNPDTNPGIQLWTTMDASPEIEPKFRSRKTTMDACGRWEALSKIAG